MRCFGYEILLSFDSRGFTSSILMSNVSEKRPLVVRQS